jgi:hypothetical protein
MLQNCIAFAIRTSYFKLQMMAAGDLCTAGARVVVLW